MNEIKVPIYEEKKKPNFWKVAIFVLVLIILVLLILLILPYFLDSTGLHSGQILDNKTCSKIEKVTFIGTTSCGHCIAQLKTLKEIQGNRTFEYLTTEENITEINKLGFMISRVPVTIINCQVYIGEMTKKTLEGLINV